MKFKDTGVSGLTGKYKVPARQKNLMFLLNAYKKREVTFSQDAVNHIKENKKSLYEQYWPQAGNGVEYHPDAYTNRGQGFSQGTISPQNLNGNGTRYATAAVVLALLSLMIGGDAFFNRGNVTRSVLKKTGILPESPGIEDTLKTDPYKRPGQASQPKKARQVSEITRPLR